MRRNRNADYDFTFTDDDGRAFPDALEWRRVYPGQEIFLFRSKEAIEVTPDYVPERFKGQHAVGYVMAALSLVLMGGAVILGAWDGIKNEYGFWQFFVRFLVMLLLLKAFDVIFFDWVLLCNQGFGFFTHYYPQVGAIYNRKLFGYNKKTHITQVILIFPLCVLLAWICIKIG